MLVITGLDLAFTMTELKASDMLFTKVSHFEPDLKKALLQCLGGIFVRYSNALAYVAFAALHINCFSFIPGCFFLKLLYRCLTQNLCSIPSANSSIAGKRPCCKRKQT